MSLDLFLENLFHETYFMRKHVQGPAKHKYAPASPTNDYLLQRQRGSLDGLAENMTDRTVSGPQQILPTQEPKLMILLPS